tara:strand:+ start:419 stop:673 length:255 start_codon:yes stop_codon:yes gene_type:complete
MVKVKIYGESSSGEQRGIRVMDAIAKKGSNPSQNKALKNQETKLGLTQKNSLARLKKRWEKKNSSLHGALRTLVITGTGNSDTK